MNTGDKNTYGRTIFKGVRGGTYVTGMGGKKIYKFTKAAGPVPAPVPTSVSIPASVNRTPPSKHTGFTKTTYIYGGLLPVYIKNASGRYYYESTRGKLSVMKLNYPVRNSVTGLIKPVRAMRAGPPRVSSHSRAAPPAPAPARVPTAPEGKMPTPSPRRVITSAERNNRLAAIKARLNAIMASRRAAMPRGRTNVENRLRSVARRARERHGRVNVARGYKTSELSIPICRSTASVPRKKCITRKTVLNVYTGGPLIDSGAIVAMKMDDFDIEWFKRQNKYISKLNDYDYWTVQAHTNRSHAWIGPYTRDGRVPIFIGLGLGGGKHITPLWPQIRKLLLSGRYDDTVTWTAAFKRGDESGRYRLFSAEIERLPKTIKKEALEMYKVDLKRIIAHAPKSNKKMILYRGSHFDIFKGTKGHWHNLTSFCSAAFNVRHALSYGSNGFQRITILPGTSVLLVAGMNQWNQNGEYEVMVNIDTKYLIRSRGVMRPVYYNDRLQETVRVTDVTIAK